ncbi:uncharacterized protein BDV17DRAFT_261987 [Aspergillus undulatus]|uniref:uncharacterized protein n=1 Tax=Aspergillus undulatus TaxID=1810928 RepID=UPI003CCD7846
MLLDERGEDLPITANVLKAAVQNDSCGWDVLRQLYMERGEDILLREEVLKAAAELPRFAIRFFLEDHWQVQDSSS